MPLPNAEPVLEENPDLELGPFGAKLLAVEVAKHLKVHPSTVHKMAKRGELPGFKIGTEWRFDRGQIEEWIRSHTKKPEG
ncbi:MAG: helix-turn-helix domain-containing protein [Deltaproteobacteria bacterium]|nr:helix-turn-helix domain-containing protein [Deltaproteobacteria bacterium]